jgi:hypothetical protein
MKAYNYFNNGELKRKKKIILHLEKLNEIIYRIIHENINILKYFF